MNWERSNRANGTPVPGVGQASCLSGGASAFTGGDGNRRAPHRTGGTPVPLRRAEAAFTLAEVLAAMLFMAIVIPVAILGLRLASQAGEVATRKAIATRIGEKVLNEMIVTRQTLKSSQMGLTREGQQDYRWTLQVEPSSLDLVRLATVQVFYPVQGKEYDVRLSTLVTSQ